MRRIKQYKKINETKSWFFEKTNKIDKLLARLIKKKRVYTQKTESEMKKITMYTMEIQGIMREYYEKLDA